MKPNSEPTNRLAHEKSPYLLQHQHNPVDWYPWGEEAFEKARREQKPIFLSVGYSTCHWCHVMAHESFENPDTAKVMNEHFVCIKVDREERPDVDRVYMTFVQATTGSGGWPMSVFLTPDLKPFYGGTYFPPDSKFGRPGFTSLLLKIADAWKTDHANVVASAANAVAALKEMSSSTTKAGGVELKHVMAAFDILAKSYDEEWGGFGRSPKFPHPVSLNLLLRVYAREGPASRDGKAALGMTLATLEKMAAGGMHDHLGGGFHRYSVDRFWHIPHFEKMLYDQGQLANSYVDAFQITGDAAHQKVARDICDYVLRDLLDPAGGFYSAEDADSLLAHGKPEHGEGAFYIWTRAEIDQILSAEDAAIFRRFYGVEDAGNAPEGSDPHDEFKGKNTLIRRLSVDEGAKEFGKSAGDIEQSLARSRQTLFELRARRPRPHLDDKIITAWNGYMISALARAGATFGEPRYLAAAERSAKFIRQELWKDGALIRSYRKGASNVPGFADDYASLIAALLDLYEADFDITWLKWAAELQARQDALFWDAEHGGYFSVGSSSPDILIRMKEDYDGAEPSPNSLSAMNLWRLSQITVSDELRAKAEKTVSAFAEVLGRAPQAMPQMLCAAEAMLAKPRQIVIAGQRDHPSTQALLREVRTRYIPNKLVLLADAAEGQAWLGQKLEFLRTVAPVDGKPAAYVCENFVCQLPVTEPEKLRALLAK